MSRAAALTNGAMPVPSCKTTSLPTLYAKTLSYLLNASMVAMYWLRRFVDQEGETRSMEPFSGRARSILEYKWISTIDLTNYKPT